MCNLSYSNVEICAANQALQDEWMDKLGVLRDGSFEVWSDTVSSLRDDSLLLESQAITGFLRAGAAPGFAAEKPVPFVCFRGSASVFDFHRDLQSVQPALLYSSQGRVLGECGRGFLQMHSELLKPQFFREGDGAPHTRRLLETVLRNVGSAENGLLICGHSLGGAVSTLFYAELLADHPEIVERYCPGDKCSKGSIKIVTFGAPRAVDLRLADRLDNSPAQHLRFVNDNDVITAAPPRRLQLFSHWGKCFFAPERFHDEKVFARKFMVVHDPWSSANSLGGRDFGVDRLSQYGLCKELLECLRDLFAAHMLSKEKGYAGQFANTGFATVNTMMDHFQWPEEEANANAIGPRASVGDIAKSLLKRAMASARKYALPICAVALVVYGPSLLQHVKALKSSSHAEL